MTSVHLAFIYHIDPVTVVTILQTTMTNPLVRVLLVQMLYGPWGIASEMWGAHHAGSASVTMFCRGMFFKRASSSFYKIQMC